MNGFLALWLGHLIADFPLQTNRIYQLKTQSWLGIALHVAIHLVTTSLLIQDFFLLPLLWIPLAITHYLFDYIKVHLKVENRTWAFVVDQFAHVSVLASLAWLFPNLHVLLPTWYVQSGLFYALLPAVMVLLWTISLDLIGTQPKQPKWILWGNANLLYIAQAISWPLIVALLLGVLWYW